MKKVIILRFAEIHLKGKNKKFFLDNLHRNIIDNTKQYDVGVQWIFNRFIVTYDDAQLSDVVRVLKYTAGISSLSVGVQIDTNIDGIKQYISSISIEDTFKVSCKRADKTFPHRSSEFAAMMGEVVLDSNPSARVDLSRPKNVIYIDIRERGSTLLYNEVIEGVGGLPLDRKAEGLLMLSGGIDSPVAGFCMGRRGLRQDILHFNSYPYTSPLAKDKVIQLAKLIQPYIGAKKMYVISMTKLQEKFHKNCREDYAVTLLRRNMYRIAEILCKKYKYKTFVTGENLGQVASQTIEGLTVSGSVLQGIPVLRPLIGYNKNDIIKTAEEIGTFETSILPYEDCCTVFLPKNPSTKPKTELAILEEEKIELMELIDSTIFDMEIIQL